MPTLRKAPFYRKYFLVLEHVITGARELVRHRLDRHRAVTFGLLLLVEPPRGLAVTHRKVRRLDE